MYYIISSVGIDYLRKFNIPRDEYGNQDLKTYFETSEGRLFAGIIPLRISRVMSKKDAVSSISMTLNILKLCYNCPLTVSLMSNNKYFELFHFSFSDYRNNGNVHTLTNLMNEQYFDKDKTNINKTTQYMLSKEWQYFSGDGDKLENVVKQFVTSTQFRVKPIWELHIK